MKKKEFSMQGDVQLMDIGIMPVNVKKIEKRPIALGELSGHQHTITGDYELFEDEEGNTFAAVGSDGATLQHLHEKHFISFDSMVRLPEADHKAVVLEPNKNFMFAIHQKFEPFKKVYERVID